jgi:two-component system response regulator HydG
MRGAFTGATQDKPGLVEAANGGTLFLDEIGEIPLLTQAKLLRFMQSRETRRLGANVTKIVNVRLVAATNRNLREMVRDGKFREDLYYRLATIQIRLPRLAERREDLPLLIRYFLDRNAERMGRIGFTLSRKAASMLTGFEWPGNVRELESVLSYACMMARSEVVDAADLPEWLNAGEREAPARLFTGDLISMDEAQRRHARFVLKNVGGNRTRAAEILQLSRATLYRLVPQEKR